MNNLQTVSGGFDDLRLKHIQELAALSGRGKVHVLLWSDELFQLIENKYPRFPLVERLYFLKSLRYVDQVSVIHRQDGRDAPRFCLSPEQERPPERERVVVTGCFDWLHTGHIRFFEEVSEHGDLYAVVGNDANVELLKGKGHPKFSQEDRRFMVGSIRYVRHAMVSTGKGWMDAAPEIERISPHLYAVNEDGDKPEKRAFCLDRGIRYLVLKRAPRQGLSARSSTTLRGF